MLTSGKPRLRATQPNSIARDSTSSNLLRSAYGRAARRHVSGKPDTFLGLYFVGARDFWQVLPVRVDDNVLFILYRALER